jgi:hypothetical protein
MRFALLAPTLALATLLSACGEKSSPIGPTPVASVAAVDAADPLDDAITRIAPVFENSEAAAGLEVALLRAKNGESAALALAEQMLARLERDNPALLPDVDAMRLALRAAR